MSKIISNESYAAMYGPTTGDRVRLADTDIIIEVEKDFCVYGEEVKFSNSCGLIFQKEAVGLVEAIGPQVQVTSGDVSVIYQGDVILGRLAMGVAPLNPAAAVELVAGAAVNSGNTAAF